MIQQIQTLIELVISGGFFIYIKTVKKTRQCGGSVGSMHQVKSSDYTSCIFHFVCKQAIWWHHGYYNALQTFRLWTQIWFILAFVGYVSLRWCLLAILTLKWRTISKYQNIILTSIITWLVFNRNPSFINISEKVVLVIKRVWLLFCDLWW